MPYKDPEDEIRWRENNRDWHKTPVRRQKQKEKRIKDRKKEMENLPDKYEYIYDNNKKSKTRYSWKKKGLDMKTFSDVWNIYINTDFCQVCNISLKKCKKNMDHNHKTKQFRYVCCHRCNAHLRYSDENFEKVMKQLTLPHAQSHL
tara:strand:- start:322 stop:759 length:438 start_codon:yes stop_codon:yes gene_type:complete